MINTQRTNTQQKIIDYFEGAGLDYYYWDHSFNMHFGYFKLGMNPFNRPALLDQMNQEMMERLRLDSYVDPCCFRLWAAAWERYPGIWLKNTPEAQFYGFTITPWQVVFGNELTKEQAMDDQVCLYQSDFASLPIANESAEAAFAMESSCYASGKDKKDLIQELYRVLKPGGRFVINDGFRKHSQLLPKWLDKVYRKKPGLLGA